MAKEPYSDCFVSIGHCFGYVLISSFLKERGWCMSIRSCSAGISLLRGVFVVFHLCYEVICILLLFYNQPKEIDSRFN